MTCILLMVWMSLSYQGNQLGFIGGQEICYNNVDIIMLPGLCRVTWPGVGLLVLCGPASLLHPRSHQPHYGAIPSSSPHSSSHISQTRSSRHSQNRDIYHTIKTTFWLEGPFHLKSFHSKKYTKVEGFEVLDNLKNSKIYFIANKIYCQVNKYLNCLG